MILKLQTDTTGTRLLVYNEDRSIQHEDDCPDVLRVVMGPMGKRYCEGTINENGEIEISGMLPPDHYEDW